MENNGWLKLYKSLLKWEWYHDVNTTRLFIHCLLRANWESQNFMGVEVKAGSFVSSFRKLAEECNLTEREVRTAINHLKSTHELTQTSYSKFTVFTVVKWGDFQDKRHNKGQTSDTQATHERHEYKNKRIEEDKNNIYSACARTRGNKFNNFPQRDFDYDTLEEKLAGFKRG